MKKKRNALIKWLDQEGDNFEAWADDEEYEFERKIQRNLENEWDFWFAVYNSFSAAFERQFKRGR